MSLPPPDKKIPKAPAPTPQAADWDDLLGEAKASGISPDMARALLQMNPAMRAQGVNTAWVVSQSQDAQHQAQKGEKPSAKPAGEAPAKPAIGDIYQLIEAHEKRLLEEEARLDVEMRKLQEAKAQSKTRVLSELMAALVAKDPELLSPFTQQALVDKKTALDRIGFSVKAFAEFKRKK